MFGSVISSYDEELMKVYASQAVSEHMENQRRWEEEERKQYDTRFNWIAFLAHVIQLAVLLLILYLIGLLIYYIWSYWKSGRSGPITRTPICPVNDKTLERYREDQGNILREAKILYWPWSDKGNKGSTKVDTILKMIFNLKNVKENLVPTYTRIVSIKMEGFDHGDKCYEFVPTDGETHGSHYSYQMYGKNKIEVTRFVVGGKSYVAGFCIYIENPSIWNVHYNMNLIKKLIKSEKYPGKKSVRSVATAPIYTELQFKYCSKLQRDVMTKEETEIEFIVSHQEWDKYEGKMTTEKCDVCSKKLSINMPPPAYSVVAVSEF